jgi:hypothetical protein
LFRPDFSPVYDVGILSNIGKVWSIYATFFASL